MLYTKNFQLEKHRIMAHPRERAGKTHTGSHAHHNHTLYEEFLCHFPYSLFAVALSLITLSLLGYTDVSSGQAGKLHGLFHTLHFLHILFAGTSTVLAFRKHSKSFLGTLLVGSLVPALFCTLSDAIIPYFGGTMAGLHMHFHWCFVDHLGTVLPFLFMGVFNGLVMSTHEQNSQSFYSGSAHFAHIFISAFASTVYLVSHGFYNWSHHMGFVFVYLMIAVLIPCTIADVVVPSWFGMLERRRSLEPKRGRSGGSGSYRGGNRSRSRYNRPRPNRSSQQ